MPRTWPEPEFPWTSAISLSGTGSVMHPAIGRLRRWPRPFKARGQREDKHDSYALLVQGVLYGPASQQECTAALSRLPAAVMHAELAVSSFLSANRPVLQQRALVELVALQMPTDACGGLRTEES